MFLTCVQSECRPVDITVEVAVVVVVIAVVAVAIAVPGRCPGRGERFLDFRGLCFGLRRGGFRIRRLCLRMCGCGCGARTRLYERFA